MRVRRGVDGCLSVCLFFWKGVAGGGEIGLLRPWMWLFEHPPSPSETTLSIAWPSAMCSANVMLGMNSGLPGSRRL
ncbi:hypothetical protein F5Y09DRAFT_300170 [Xylaria sp. FL1042]|nr:hypothetical protein F5Y09DRAFT_300170 [Xylaria sp. FL1042]